MPRRLLLAIMNLTCLYGLTACQSVPPAETTDINNDVCIGDPIVITDPDAPIDLEEMAKQAECP